MNRVLRLAEAAAAALAKTPMAAAAHSLTDLAIRFHH
jgi:ApbE superfamily uncharacterized protein (UPF0280 family)